MDETVTDVVCMRIKEGRRMTVAYKEALDVIPEAILRSKPYSMSTFRSSATIDIDVTPGSDALNAALDNGLELDDRGRGTLRYTHPVGSTRVTLMYRVLGLSRVRAHVEMAINDLDGKPVVGEPVRIIDIIEVLD